MAVPKFLLNIDWVELKKQKLVLLNTMNRLSIEDIETIEGIVSIIDAMQDYAVDVLGIDNNDVFDVDVDDKTSEPVVADNDPYVCSNCGSINVENKVWVNANTGVISGSILDEDDNDCWCNDCEEHHELVLKSEFNY